MRNKIRPKHVAMIVFIAFAVVSFLVVNWDKSL